jgi:hypothetical protein
VAVTLLMAKASNAVLLSFMGEAPFFLFLMPVFFCDPAIWFRTHSGIANVCMRLVRRFQATRLRESEIRSPGFG